MRPWVPGFGVRAVTAAVTLRRVRSPPAAASFSARHAVGTDSTGPSSSRWSSMTRKSLITALRPRSRTPGRWRPGPGHDPRQVTAAPHATRLSVKSQG